MAANQDLSGIIKIRTLVHQLGDDEVGHHALWLLSNIELSQYGRFVQVVEESRKLQHQAAFELLRVLHPKLLVGLERVERQVARLKLPTILAKIRAANDLARQNCNYQTTFEQIEELIDQCSTENSDIVDEALFAVRTLSEGVLATRHLAQLLLCSLSPQVRQQTDELLQRMGEFGRGVIEEHSQSANGYLCVQQAG